MTKERTLLLRKCDTAFSGYIKGRDGSCLKCGSFGPLECAHIIPRKNHKLRCDTRNAVTLCSGCHHVFTNGPKLEWEQFIDGKFGDEFYLNLHLEALDVTFKSNILFWRSEWARLKELEAT